MGSFSSDHNSSGSQSPLSWAADPRNEPIYSQNIYQLPANSTFKPLKKDGDGSSRHQNIKFSTIQRNPNRSLSPLSKSPTTVHIRTNVGVTCTLPRSKGSFSTYHYQKSPQQEYQQPQNPPEEQHINVEDTKKIRFIEQTEESPSEDLPLPPPPICSDVQLDEPNVICRYGNSFSADPDIVSEHTPKQQIRSPCEQDCEKL